MNTDIVDALRTQADKDEEAGTMYSHVVNRRAADEIERLRAEVEALRKVVELMDRCLKDLHPYGAEGVIFDRWNQARTILVEMTK